MLGEVFHNAGTEKLVLSDHLGLFILGNKREWDTRLRGLEESYQIIAEDVEDKKVTLWQSHSKKSVQLNAIFLVDSALIKEGPQEEVPAGAMFFDYTDFMKTSPRNKALSMKKNATVLQSIDTNKPTSKRFTKPSVPQNSNLNHKKQNTFPEQMDKENQPSTTSERPDDENMSEARDPDPYQEALKITGPSRVKLANLHQSTEEFVKAKSSVKTEKGVKSAMTLFSNTIKEANQDDTIDVFKIRDQEVILKYMEIFFRVMI